MFETCIEQMEAVSRAVPSIQTKNLTTKKVLSHQLQILGAGTNAIANVHEARGRLIAGLDILARAWL